MKLYPSLFQYLCRLCSNIVTFLRYKTSYSDKCCSIFRQFNLLLRHFLNKCRILYIKNSRTPICIFRKYLNKHFLQLIRDAYYFAVFSVYFFIKVSVMTNVFIICIHPCIFFRSSHLFCHKMGRISLPPRYGSIILFRQFVKRFAGVFPICLRIMKWIAILCIFTQEQTCAYSGAYTFEITREYLLYRAF